MKKSKPHILVLTESLKLGGTPKHLFESLPELKRQGVEFSIWTVSGYEHYYYKLLDEGIRVKSVKPSRLGLSLVRFLLKNRNTIVHTFFFHDSLKEVLVARLFGAKVIKSTRNEGHWRKGGLKEKLRILIRTSLVNHHITNRDAGKQYLIEKESVKESQVTVIPNGIVDRYNTFLSVNGELFKNKNSLKLVVLQRLNANKNTRFVLECISDLIKKLDVELVVVGYGQKKKELERYVKENGLDKNVHIVGYTTDPFPIIKSCDVMVSSSLNEGMSNSILEGVMMGLACIVSVANNSGMVVDEENGFFFAPDESGKKEFIDKVMLLDKNRELLNSMKSRSRELYLERYQIEAQTELTMNFFKTNFPKYQW